MPNADAACLHASREQREDNSACSQQDAKTLQDLTELAGEGLTLTQWNLDLQQVEGSGEGELGKKSSLQCEQ